MPLHWGGSARKENRMKRRLILVFSLVVVLSLVAAAPVTAKGPKQDRQPPSGHQVMILNVEVPTDPTSPLGYYGCDDISWFGTIEIDGKTFGMALYPDFEYDGPLDYGEGWKIFSGTFKVDKDGMLKRCAPGRVVMEGHDEGVYDPSTGEFASNGDVEYAVGYFKWWGDGYKVRQGGTTGFGVSVAGVENAFGFDNGTFEVYESAEPKPHARPFKAFMTGEMTWDETAFECLPITGIPVRTGMEATGWASHLGRSTLAGSHCTPTANDYGPSEMTLVAANGDEVHMGYQGVCPPFMDLPIGDVLTCSLEFDIVGGTGRFADATGEGSGTVSLVWLGVGEARTSAWWTWTGTIGY
jgi:hypothetical protein